MEKKKAHYMLCSLITRDQVLDCRPFFHTPTLWGYGSDHPLLQIMKFKIGELM